MRRLPGAGGLVALDQVHDHGDHQQQHAGLHAGQHRADGHDGMQHVADDAHGAQAGLALRAGQALAARQLGQHALGTDIEGGQRHDRVEPQVGDLVDQFVGAWGLAVGGLRHAIGVVRVLGGEHHLGGFLADLLEDLVQALGEQLGHVALVRIALGSALRDDVAQMGQDVEGGRDRRGRRCRLAGGRGRGGSVVGAHRFRLRASGWGNAGRILEDRLHRRPLAVLQLLEEAAVAAGVAGDAGLMAVLGDAQQHHIVVAVQPDAVDLLRVAGLLTLVPQLLARAAPVDRLADLGGCGPGPRDSSTRT
ncbi:hypothetical protein Ddc_23553 [Ditylenchus destructor]|nr:hypothetical protein Ddc_23553 [Ditylenchus destructor]